ncbi:uncharacterized protein KD926_000425 [Aspergillus affinis]|uniref:uncharacterized protein n=1 Tax=Aspergillus affinis TaxID=1070780 RepID=UPI0022FE772D|nr:uncharacterized protein KD926_000425 [Aspergillus affinis]KAI9044514.1 hypothetical protein KD926_000425 [Aspergillus affinis]
MIMSSMAYPRADPTPFTLDDEDRMYPMQRTNESFPAPKGPDPLSSNWNYDSAIDLFSLNTMLPEPFPMEMPSDMMGMNPKDFPTDFFAPPPDISGFTISNHSGEDCASMSSDLESDDQSWSPTYVAPADLPKSITTSSRPTTRRRTNAQQKPQITNPRWSSSPEITPQEYSAPLVTSPQPAPASPPASNRKMTRSLSGDSQSSTGPATTTGRNAAKRAAHNIIEKRYRTNMNAKFVSLEKAMCGGVQKSTKGGSASLKKSEILTNAIAYMHELQEENKAMQKELALYKQGLVPNGIWRPTK